MRQNAVAGFVLVGLLTGQLLGCLLAAQAEGTRLKTKDCPVLGLSDAKIYYVPGDHEYRTWIREKLEEHEENRACFRTTTEAKAAGYRRENKH